MTTAYGQWDPTLDPGQRVERFKLFTEVAAAFLRRQDHPLVKALLDAEVTGDPTRYAFEMFEALPRLHQRHILASYNRYRNDLEQHNWEDSKMVDVRQFFSRQALKGSDLTGELEVIIENVGTVPDQYGRLPVTFDDGNVLACNDSQVFMIERMFGPETDHWIGHSVTLYPVNVKIKDRDTGEQKDVTTIRIKKSASDSAEVAKTRQAEKPAQNREALNDEIPF